MIAGINFTAGESLTHESIPKMAMSLIVEARILAWTAMGRKLAILTSGGDSQGMNAVVRAVVRTAIYHEWVPYVVFDGYAGLVEADRGNDRIMPFKWNDVAQIISMGGTVIRTARCEAFKKRSGRLAAAKNLIERGIYSLVVVGGDGSMTGAELLRSEWQGLHEELVATKELDPELPCSFLSVVGIVGSIDNDMVGTEMTIGASSSLHRIVEAIDAISTSAYSHQRAFIIEVMGRHCGWLALMSAIACGADYFLIPEQPVQNWKEKMCDRIRCHRSLGKREAIIIVSEGAANMDNQIITSKEVATALYDCLGLEARVTTLGHVQRGGKPSAYDRIIGTLQGVYAVQVLMEQNESQEGKMIGVQANQIVTLPLTEAVKITRSIGRAMEERDFARAFDLRDPDFRDAYSIIKCMFPAMQVQDHSASPNFAIVHVGAPAAGMNCITFTFVQYLIGRNGRPLVFLGGWNATAVKQFSWIDVDGWMSSGGCDVGVDRALPDPERVSALFEKHNINGCLIVGGYEALLSIRILAAAQTRFPALRVPMVMIPATISNNVPGSHYSVGSDTALNLIVSCCDIVRQSAASSMRRVFLVELQGGNCGFLTQMSGIAAGALNCYIPEQESIKLKDLENDVLLLKEKFASDDGLQGRLILVNERVVERFLSIDTMSHLITLEGDNVFDSRTCKLGHLQQGSSPSPLDRIFAVKLAALAVDDLLSAQGTQKAIVLGIQKGRICRTDVLDKEFIALCNDDKRVPRYTWWLQYRTVAKMLANQSLSDAELKELKSPLLGRLA